MTRFKAGDLAGVGCLVDSDRTCPECQAGLEQFCPNGTLTYNGRDKHLGGVTYGGYSDSVVVDERFVLRVPANLDLAAAAPLFCAGIATYSPMRHWGVSAGGSRYAWELARGRMTWRVPVQGRCTTGDSELMRILAVAGVGLVYAFEPQIADDLRRGRLRLVLEPYAAAVPGFFLYFPSRAQVSPALRAFVDVARGLAGQAKRRPS